jgi:hypothetical protein
MITSHLVLFCLWCAENPYLRVKTPHAVLKGVPYPQLELQFHTRKIRYLPTYCNALSKIYTSPPPISKKRPDHISSPCITLTYRRSDATMIFSATKTHHKYTGPCRLSKSLSWPPHPKTTKPPPSAVAPASRPLRPTMGPQDCLR